MDNIIFYANLALFVIFYEVVIVRNHVSENKTRRRLGTALLPFNWRLLILPGWYFHWLEKKD